MKLPETNSLEKARFYFLKYVAQMHITYSETDETGKLGNSIVKDCLNEMEKWNLFEFCELCHSYRKARES